MSVWKVPSHVLWKKETFIEEDTRYRKHCTQDNDASVPFKAVTLGPHWVLLVTIRCPIIFPWISLMVWNSSLSKVILVLGKARSRRAPDLAYRVLVTWVIRDFAKNLCRWCEAWMGALSWWSCQSPVAHSCGLLNHRNSFHGGTFMVNTKFDADLLLYLLSHFECNGHTVHMLTQPPPLTRTARSSLFTHAHSSPLSLAARLHWCHVNDSHYVNNGSTFSRQTSYIWILPTFET